jgi:hypothetical protein
LQFDNEGQTADLYPASSPSLLARAKLENRSLAPHSFIGLLAAVGLVWFCQRRSDLLSLSLFAQSYG